uniref:Nuclear condensin complex subunit 3 C-terminal domain-containing protein n=1 Tax=Panagrolaimus sp. JU765 TaxID=591449 RepID=A0AC34RSD1_9BILA
RKVIDIVKREGISAIEEKRSPRIVNEIQRVCLKYLLKLIPFLDKDDLGMQSWKSLLYQLLTENLLGCELDAELYYLIVYQFVYHHFNVKNPEEMDRAVHEIGDICYGIAGTGQHYGTQDLDLSQQTEATQFGLSMMSESQFNVNMTIRPREDPAIEMTDEQMLKCVSVLAAVVKTGFFLNPNPVFFGLIVNFSVRAFDTTRHSEVKNLAFICIAAMASITDQNERNFIRYARAVLDNNDEPDDLKKTALMMLNDAIQIYGFQTVKDWYFQEMPDEHGVKKYEILKKLIELAEKTGATSLNRFTIRIMLRLIIFDYTKTFKELLIYLLLRMFRKDDEMTDVLYQFFLNYASCSREHQCIIAQASVEALINREHQCIIAQASVEALIKLTNCDMGSPEAKINKNLFAEFIVNITSYSVLKPRACKREFGTTHTILARHLIVKLNVAQEDGFDELLAWIIGNCEVTEVCDAELAANLKKACKKVVSQTDSGKVKRHLDTFYKRLESLEKHLTSKKSKKEMPQPRTAAEIEKELQSMMAKLKLMTEETNSEKRSWLTREDIGETDENVPKMKIWGEKTFDKHKFLSQITSKEVTSPPAAAPKSVRRTGRTPSANTTPRNLAEVASTPVNPSRVTRNTRKRLAPVPEDVMDFIE